MQFVDFDAVEVILHRFGAPFVEWATCVRNNLRDIRCGWLLWSQHVEAHRDAAREKMRKRQHIRLEKKRAREILLGTGAEREEDGHKGDERVVAARVDQDDDIDLESELHALAEQIAAESELDVLAEKVTVTKAKKRARPKAKRGKPVVHDTAAHVEAVIDARSTPTVFKRPRAPAPPTEPTPSKK